MKEKGSKTVYEKIEKFLDKSKIPTAYVLFIYITSVQFVPDKWVSTEFKEVSIYPILIVFGIIILRIFFEIYTKIFEPENALPLFPSWSKLVESGELKEKFDKRLYDDKAITINLFGVSSRFYWAYFKNLIDECIEKDKNLEFTINIAVLDPDFYNSAEFITEDFKSKFLNQGETTIKDINTFLDFLARRKSRCKCQVNIKKYRFMPPFYGISLDNRFLYLGNTYWGEHTLRSAGQSYNRYEEDDDFSGSEKIRVFNSWFDYIDKNNVN